MRGKKYIYIFLIFVLTLSFSLILKAEAAKVIKFAHVGSSEDARQKAGMKFKEMVESETDGEITVELYYGGQLGGDRDAIEGVKLGTIQMTVAGAGIFANFEPKMGITALPFLFENFEKAWAFNDSDINAEVNNLLVNQGMRVLAYWENGFRCLTNSVKPVNSPEDVKGMKIPEWCPLQEAPKEEE